MDRDQELLSERALQRISVVVFVSECGASKAVFSYQLKQNVKKNSIMKCHCITKGLFFCVFLFPHSLSWVVFEEPGFCGESYLLEKGLYGSPEDWGALQPSIGSVMPVAMVRASSDSEKGSPLFCLGGKIARLICSVFHICLGVCSSNYFQVVSRLARSVIYDCAFGNRIFM